MKRDAKSSLLSIERLKMSASYPWQQERRNQPS
jgi:hypothetical protein